MKESDAGECAALFIEIADDWPKWQHEIAAFDFEGFGAQQKADQEGYHLLHQIGYSFGASKGQAFGEVLNVWQHPKLADNPLSSVVDLVARVTYSVDRKNKTEADFTATKVHVMESIDSSTHFH